MTKTVEKGFTTMIRRHLIHAALMLGYIDCNKQSISEKERRTRINQKNRKILISRLKPRPLLSQFLRFK